MIFANELYKIYEDTEALKGVSFHIDEGELFGFIGPDGAGKSTLFRILTSLIKPTTGNASMCGYDVVKDYRKIRHITGYMPGRFSLYSDLSVEENLDFFATVFGTTISENYDLIRDVYIQIEPFNKRRAGKLSGGMKQKLALSCALIHKPKVLILDEPTTGVDAVSRSEFWELLKGLKSKGITIVVSTPYMDEAEMCDRVALIQDGTILSIDTPQQIVKTHQQELYSISSDNIYKLLTDLKNITNTKNVFAFGHSVHYSSYNKVNLAQLKKYLKSLNHSNVQIKTITPNIEDVFIDLVQNKRTEN